LTEPFKKQLRFWQPPNLCYTHTCFRRVTFWRQTKQSVNFNADITRLKTLNYEYIIKCAQNIYHKLMTQTERRQRHSLVAAKTM